MPSRATLAWVFGTIRCCGLGWHPSCAKGHSLSPCATSHTLLLLTPKDRKALVSALVFRSEAAAQAGVFPRVAGAPRASSPPPSLGQAVLLCPVLGLSCCPVIARHFGSLAGPGSWALLLLKALLRFKG